MYQNACGFNLMQSQACTPADSLPMLSLSCLRCSDCLWWLLCSILTLTTSASWTFSSLCSFNSPYLHHITQTHATLLNTIWANIRQCRLCLMYIQTWQPVCHLHHIIQTHATLLNTIWANIRQCRLCLMYIQTWQPVCHLHHIIQTHATLLNTIWANIRQCRLCLMYIQTWQPVCHLHHIIQTHATLLNTIWANILLP